MKEKEKTIGIWIHHLATLFGVLFAIRQLAGGRQSRPGRCGLIAFTILQLWATLKIVCDIVSGKSRLEQSYDSIRAASKNEDQASGIFWSLVAASAAFKVMTPFIFGKKSVHIF